MAAKRLIFVQNGLSKPSGHWLRETNEFRAAAQKLSLEWLGFAHCDLDKTLAASCAATPAFPHTPYDRYVNPQAPESAWRSTQTLIPQAFAQACTEYFPKDLCGGDILLVANTTAKELLGTSLWLQTIPAPKRPNAVFYIHHQDPGWQVDLQTGSITGDFTLWQEAIQALQLHLPPQKMRIYAASAILANAMARILNFPVGTVPLTLKAPAQTPPDDVSRAYDIAMLGGGRQEQGAGLGAAIIAELAKSQPGLTAMVQVESPEYAAALKHTPAGVRVRCEPFLDAEFDRQLSQSRFMLMPYAPASYSMRESGVFSEAAMLGIPAAVSAQTPMAKHIQSGRAAGIVFGYDEPVSAIAAKIAAAMKNPEALNRKGRSNSADWIKRHSAENTLREMIAGF